MKTAEKFVGFDALKQSVSMAQVLDRYGLLERLHRNGDGLNGVCPIHAGHNPMQFRVSLSKNCWICFGDCHTGGSIVDFVSRKERIGIRDAASETVEIRSGLAPGDTILLGAARGISAGTPVKVAATSDTGRKQQ